MGVSISLSNTSPKPGDTVTVSWSLKNDFMASYYFKVDLYTDGKYIKNLYKGRLSSGSSRSGSTSIIAQEGTHTVEVVASLSIDGTTWTDYDSASKSYTTRVGFTLKSWSINANPKEVQPGDTINITATVYWEAPGGVKFKLKINGFGHSWISNEVSASSSPTVMSTRITVPSSVSPGTYQISVSLQAYY